MNRFGRIRIGMSLAVAIVLVAVVLCWMYWPASDDAAIDSDSGLHITAGIIPTTDFSDAAIAADELISACFDGPDCLPSIDQPQFESVATANQWLNDDDDVLVLNRFGVQRAYPVRILNWHPVVNDTVNGKPLLITYCPLCGSSRAFVPRVNGGFTRFGVSGFVRNSNLVLYDRYEGNLWQQFTGTALAGPAVSRSESLTPIEITLTTWVEWKEQYPNTEVLSRTTGYMRDYEQNPYADYATSAELLYPVLQPVDDRLAKKEVVFGVHIGDAARAYTESDLRANTEIHDQLGDRPITIRRLAGGQVIVGLDDTSGQTIPADRSYWFAWAGFYPNTSLYTPSAIAP